ncbi:MAG TPA: hypothetical protein VM617_01585 [Thermoanaerobaculia bacterium]|nr:hypothetical protein [Thermoanaerobaculia bacterium]
MRHRQIALALWFGLAAGPAMAITEPATGPSAEQVEAAFERFRALEGEWRARSTMGWTSRSEFRLLGRGTVVLAIASFDDAPRERDMASAFHRDGGRLLLTHYCEAGNQPRLVATRIAADGREVEFEFLDGTGMSSRDAGHMDRAVFRFLDDGSFTSRWTWFQGGEERWMEAITYLRTAAPVTREPSQPEESSHH